MKTLYKYLPRLYKGDIFKYIIVCREYKHILSKFKIILDGNSELIDNSITLDFIKNQKVIASKIIQGMVSGKMLEIDFNIDLVYIGLNALETKKSLNRYIKSDMYHMDNVAYAINVILPMPSKTYIEIDKKIIIDLPIEIHEILGRFGYYINQYTLKYKKLLQVENQINTIESEPFIIKLIRINNNKLNKAIALADSLKSEINSIISDMEKEFNIINLMEETQ